MKKSELRQIIREEIDNSSPQIVAGKLNVVSYQEDEAYYVDTDKFGPILVSNKFIDKINPFKLNQLVGRLHKWNMIEWDHRAERHDERYRIVGIHS